MADNNKLPDPILRTEKYLAKIAENTANLDPTPTILQANKTITQNGVVEPDSGFDGFAKVTANVPNTYTAADEGKVVDNGELVTQIPTVINTNSTVDTTLYNQVTVSVPNTYTAEDEGKVVDNGALVAQTSTNITSNGTVDTTLNNSAVVNVPNTYTAQDEGKVVDNGELVSQTAYPTEITVNDTYDTTNYNSITVNVPTGGGAVEEKDVNFYDYDGTVLYSYTAQEFLALTEMPANPTHTGLTAQGWNWTLSDAQDYVTDCGKLNIGQTVTTNDGSTKLYVNLDTDIVLSPSVGFAINGNATIDWGDGSVADTVTGTSTSTIIYTSHTYSTIGQYVIKISSTDTIYICAQYINSTYYSAIFNSSVVNHTFSNDYRFINCIEKLELGNGVNIGSRGLANTFFESINLPLNVVFSSFCFMNSNIKHLNIPTTTTSLETAHFYTSVAYKIILPNTLTYIAYRSFQSCSNLDSLQFPKSVSSGNYIELCNNSRALKEIILNCPLITNMGSWHLGDASLMYCTNLILPKNITGIEGATNLGYSNFCNMYSLKNLELPNTLTSIGKNVFVNMYSLASLKFQSQTPPTIGTGCFTNIPTDCKIYVPTGTLTDYTTASNYPDPTVYTYIEY